MADLKKTIDIIFHGVDDVTGVTKSIDRSMDQLGDNLQNFGEPFADAAKKVVILEAAILAVGAAGLKARSEIEQETTKMQNALGLPIEAAEEFEEVAKRVYTTGIGDNLAESFEAVTLAAQKFGDESTDSIESIAVNAKKVESIFGQDYQKVLGSVNTLMKNFGLSSEEAFDFIAGGFQKGLDGSGDFLDSINEYATQYKNAEASAGEFFSAMETGYQEGILGTDKANDAFKEFNVRILDGSKTTQDALSQLGLGDEFVKSIIDGEIEVSKAFQVILGKIGEVDDKSVQMQAGVGLIGTQFEDMGVEAALALDLTATKMEDLKGKMDAIKPDESLGKKFTQMMRTIVTEIVDSDIWAGFEDGLGDTFDQVKDSFLAAWGDIKPSDFNNLFDAFDSLFGAIRDGLDSADLDILTEEGMAQAIQDVIDTVASITNTTAGIINVLSPVVNLFVDLARTFNELSPEAQELSGIILGLGTALVGLGSVLSIGGSVIGGLGSLTTLFGGLVAVLTGPAGLALALAGTAAALATFVSSQNDKEFNDQIAALEREAKAVEDLGKQINELPPEISTIEIFTAIETGDLKGAQELIDQITEDVHVAELKAEADDRELTAYLEKLVEIPEEKQTEVLALLNEGDEEKIKAFFEGIETEKVFDLKVDDESVAKATETLEYWLGGEKHEIVVPVETEGLDKVTNDIEEIPSEKILEIMAQGDIDVQLETIKAQAETIQTSMEWKAKLDIAEAEAGAKQMEAAFNSVNTSIESTAELIGTALGVLNDPGSFQAKWEALDILDQEQELRQKSFDLQEKLVNSQIDYMQAREDALKEGDLSIQIDSTGLEPALELIMWEIIKKVQIQATEESADFLLGIS